MLLSEFFRVPRPAMMPTPTMAAIRPYSIAVAPELVLHKASKNGVHGTLPFEVNCYYPFTGRHQCLRRLNNCKPTDRELISS